MNCARRLFLANVAIWGLCRDAGADERLHSGKLVSGKGYRGIVFAADDTKRIRYRIAGEVDGYWTPAAADVALFEKLLRAALVEGVEDPDKLSPTRPDLVYRRYLPEYLRAILSRLDQHHRQYFGVVGPGGARRLFVNFFPSLMAIDLAWKDRYVLVMDGGTAFWRIQFELPSRRFMQFETNGFA